MSTRPAVFEATLQESDRWLKLVQNALPPCDRQQAYAAFRAVTHALRDRLPADAVLGLAAQLPMLLRGIFMEGWRLPNGRSGFGDLQEFTDEVTARFPPGFPRQARDTAKAVFLAMGAKLDPGEMAKLSRQMPPALRELLPAQYRTAPPRSAPFTGDRQADSPPSLT